MISSRKLDAIKEDASRLAREVVRLRKELEGRAIVVGLPGPGGAVYGQNAMFGVVNVVTRAGADVDGADDARRAIAPHLALHLAGVVEAVASRTDRLVRLLRVLDLVGVFARLGRKNVMMKIPATPEGIPAIEQAIAQQPFEFTARLVVNIQGQTFNLFRQLLFRELLSGAKRPQPGDFRVQPHLGGTTRRCDPPPGGEALAQAVPPEAHELLVSQRRQIEEVRGQIAELKAHLEVRPSVG